MASIEPITELGKQILRAKQIQAISFNGVLSEIVVFTKRVPPNKRQLSALPEMVDDVTIRYHQGAQDPIGEQPAQPFGGPAYIIRTIGSRKMYLFSSDCACFASDFCSAPQQVRVGGNILALSGSAS
jgi:hypothetical protein